MKPKIQLITFLLGVLSVTTCFAQSKVYYRAADGSLKDGKTYSEQREQALAAMREISKSINIYEELEQEFSRNDSLVYSYKWHFTDNVDRTKEEIEKKKALIGKVFPIRDVKTLGGRMVSIDDFKGKPTLINLWFTTCKPCVEEMPVLNQMKAAHEDRFNFLSITFESESAVRKFLKRFDFTFEHIVDSDALTSDLGFRSFPVNLFLDKEGRLRVIEGNIPYVKNENGELEISNGADFLSILEGLL